MNNYYFSMYLHPWDLIDEGAENVMNTMSEMGLSHINIATSYHCGRYILPHNPKRFVYFAEEGVIYFEPSLEFFTNTKLKPRRSQKYKDYDVVRIATEYAKSYDLRVNSWTVCLHNYELVRQHPDVAVQDPYGNIDENFMCPNNPNARRYIIGLVCNLASNYDLDFIQLESVAFPWGLQHFDHHETFGVYVHPMLSFLYSTCYCQHCEKKAKEFGINLSAAKNKARETISEIVNVPPDLYPSIPKSDMVSSLYEYLMVNETIKDLAEFKSYTSLEVLQEICENLRSINKKIRVSVISGATMWFNEGFNFEKISKIIDAIDYICYFDNPRRVENYVKSLKNMVNKKCMVIPSIRINYPINYTKENLSTSMKSAVRGGADGVALYNYGWTSKTTFSWIKTIINELK